MPLTVEESGLVAGIRSIPSPNHDDRPPGSQIELIVIHAISLPPGQFGGSEIVDLFCNRLDCNAHPYFATIRELKVSSHFLIRRDGEFIQFVSCDKRAWHAGASSWRGREGCNDFSIGIELEGTDDVPFEDAQYKWLAELTRALKAKYPIADIVGHSEIAPGRKTDPGPCFDWARYRSMIKSD